MAGRMLNRPVQEIKLMVDTIGNRQIVIEKTGIARTSIDRAYDGGVISEKNYKKLRKFYFLKKGLEDDGSEILGQHIGSPMSENKDLASYSLNDLANEIQARGWKVHLEFIGK